MIRMEMKRAFHNRNFYIALIIGCGIAIGQYIQNVLPMIKYLPMDVEKGVYPHSVFNKWIGGEYHTLWPMLFYFILPVLAALPHGDSYYQDIQSGYFKNICTRTKKSKGMGGIFQCICSDYHTTVSQPAAGIHDSAGIAA